MEFAENGDLYDLICKHKNKKVYVDEGKLWSILIQIIKGKKI